MLFFFGSRGVTEESHLDESRCRNRYTEYHTRILRKRSFLPPFYTSSNSHMLLLGHLAVLDHGSSGTREGGA